MNEANRGLSASPACIDLIKKSEGCKLEAYQDSVGIWTIGYGSTMDVHKGMAITQQEADDRLYTAYWITPIPIQLGKSSNPDYPVKITNLITGTSVSGKLISLKEALETPQGPSSQPPNGTNIIQPPQPPPSPPITPQPQGATGQ